MRSRVILDIVGDKIKENGEGMILNDIKKKKHIRDRHSDVGGEKAYADDQTIVINTKSRCALQRGKPSTASLNTEKM
jgi:hypothetical protein